jgi:hypothetical protein
MKKYSGKLVDVQVYNQFGVLVEQLTIDKAKEVPVRLELYANLPDGIYNIRFKAVGFRESTKRLILNRH